MAVDAALQSELLLHAVIGHVLPLLLNFDTTLSSDALHAFVLPFPPKACVAMLPLLNTELIRPNVAVTKSHQAVLAAQAAARIAGARSSTWHSRSHEQKLVTMFLERVFKAPLL